MMAGSGSVTAQASDPDSVRARRPVAAVTAGSLGASAPPWRATGGRAWRWRWGRLEGDPVVERPGSQRRAGGGWSQQRWCMSALQRRLMRHHHHHS